MTGWSPLPCLSYTIDMNVYSTRARRWLPLALLICCLPAPGATVYRSVDENGVVSFSDTPPEGDTAVDTLQIEARDPEPSEAERERLEAMRDTTDRMAADRREREKHRAEMRQLQATTQSPPPVQQAGYSDYTDYSSGYWGYSGYRGGYYGYPVRPWRPGRPGRPGYRPRPEHPIARPPLRHYPHPRAQINRGSNAQLMRPIVSPRR